MRLLGALLLLAGCSAVAPYVEGGAGYSGWAGQYYYGKEKGLVGQYGAGVEFRHEHWYLPSECGYYHRSMVSKKPETVTNDWLCKKRFYFGEAR